ncbi:unnamed protein product [Dibothriocephalus latus]|uniref:Uncharacterized protein n=1 Tax=Dibothriocephalus latus TaxID=60516 RepID=A0A3P7M747_DIBLA|nr:unnamed protein product [Dibothriocephalus latus]
MACSLQAEGDSIAEARAGSPGPSSRPQREDLSLMPTDGQHLAGIGVPNNQVGAASGECELDVGKKVDLDKNNLEPNPQCCVPLVARSSQSTAGCDCRTNKEPPNTFGSEESATGKTELRSVKVYRKLKEPICRHMRKLKRKSPEGEESQEG